MGTLYASVRQGRKADRTTLHSWLDNLQAASSCIPRTEGVAGTAVGWAARDVTVLHLNVGIDRALPGVKSPRRKRVERALDA